MKKQTIKQFALVASPAEALRLAEAGEKLAFRHYKSHGGFFIRTLIAIKINKPCPYEVSVGGHFKHCFAVTEIDPCQSPDGCPDLPPWWAYVGKIKGLDYNWCEDVFKVSMCCEAGRGNEWTGAASTNLPFHYAVDVRTAWAQEHFPEHCRIRAYVAPCAIDVAWNAHSNGGAYTFPREEHFRAGWKAAMSHAITNRQEILEKL